MKKVLDFFQKYLALILFGAVIAVTATAISVVATASFVNEGDNVTAGNNITGAEIGEIRENRIVKQSFVAPENNLYSFSLKFATYIRTNNCNLYINLIDVETGNSIFEIEENASYFSDNAYRTYKFDPVFNSQGRQYEIIVTGGSDATPGNSVTIWASVEDSYPDGELIINGESTERDLVFNTFYESSWSSIACFMLYGTIYLVIVTVIGFVFRKSITLKINKTVKKNSVKIANVFVALLVFIGIISMLKMIEVNYEKEAKPTKTYDVELSALTPVGYSVNDNTFLSCSGTPQIYLPSVSEKINCILVNLTEPYGETSMTRIYYASNGEKLTGVNSSTYIFEGSDSFYIEIPEGVYTSLRLDLPGNFTLENIYLANAAFENVKTVRINFQYILIFALNVIAIIIAVKKTPAKISFDKFISDEKQTLLNFAGNKFKFFFHIFYYLVFALYLIGVYIILVWYQELPYKFLIVISVLFWIVYFIDHILIYKNHKAEKYFLLTSLILGFIMAYSLPIKGYVSWDEAIHYGNSITLRNVVSVEDEINLFDNGLMRNKYTKQYDDTSDMFVEMHQDEQLKDSINSPSGLKYNFVGYIPVAFSMLIRDIFSIPFYIFVIMARFSNCLVYSVVLYYAIKRLRSGKLLLSSIALIPVAIFIASTFSYDYWVTAFTGYSLAYFIGILQEKDKIISYKDMIMIFGSLFLGCGPKAVYFVLGLPFFFIPKMKFDTLKKRKIYYISLVITLLVILCSFAVPFLISTENSTDIRGGSEVNSSEQLKYILTNPLEYMKTLLLFLSNYFTPSVGSTFYAYLGNPNSALYGSIATLIVFWSVFSDKNICDNFTNVKILKFTSFLSVFGALCLISTALYISFTSVGADSIAGVQWRYSIPLFFPFLYSLGSCKVINNMKESVKISIVFIGAFISIFGSFYTAYLMTIL